MQTWLMGFNHFFNRKRMGYGLITGGILWLGWLLSIFLGPGNMDLANQVIGTDYIQFYAAGMTIRLGESEHLYNFEYQASLEKQIIGDELKSFHAFITPPFFAYLFVPLSLLSYPLSFAVWSVLGLASLYLSIRLLGTSHPYKALIWSLTFFPVFASISFGQNSLLSLFILSLSYGLWLKRRPFLAGLACSLLLYKPQLILGIAVLWVLEYRRDWKALIGLALGSLGLATLSFIWLPQASLSYLDFSKNVLSTMMGWEQFPIWHAHTWRAFWYLLLPEHPSFAEIFWVIFALTGLGSFILFWRYQRGNFRLIFAAAICLTLWITPHAMIYDWTILLIPAMVLWENYEPLRKLWKFIFILIWVAFLLGSPLVSLQLKTIPIALQISLPIFCIALIITHKALGHKSITLSDPVQ